MTRIRWSSPYVTMMVVLAMYVVKATAKLVIGSWVHSPVISGDGMHNVADFFEAVFVIVGVFIATRPPNGKYPFGRKNVESILEVMIGLGLAVAMCVVAKDAVLGIIRSMHAASAGPDTFTPDSLRMGPRYFWWVTGVMFVSACISVGIGMYEVATGKASGRSSIIADGKETLVDSGIEFTALVGILCEYRWNAPWIEYPLALGVAFLMAKTAWELTSRGLDGLLQRSLGPTIESALREYTEMMPGVIAMTGLKTFRIGSTAIVIAKVASRCHGRALQHLKRAVLDDLRKNLAWYGFRESERYLRFERPTPHRRRDAYAIIRREGIAAIAPTLEVATHLRICDVDNDAIVRWTDVEKPINRLDVLALLMRKRVQRFVLLASVGQSADTAVSALLGGTDIASVEAHTCIPELLGM